MYNYSFIAFKMNTRILSSCFDKKKNNFESGHGTSPPDIKIAKRIHRKFKYILMCIVTMARKFADSVYIIISILLVQC